MNPAVPPSSPPETGLTGEPGEAQQPVLRRYDERLAVLKARSAALDARSHRISLLRGVTFLTALGGGAWWMFGAAPLAIKAITVAFAAIFVGLVIAHALLVTRMAELELRVALFERARRRASGDLAALPARGDRLAPPDHDYAADLDLFGNGSLFQLLCVAETGEGEATLADWLLRPASADIIAERQTAVRELASLHTFREELAVLGAQSGARGRESQPLVAWAEGAPPVTLPGAALVKVSALLVPLTLLGLAATEILGAAVLGPLRFAWLVTFAAQVVVLGALRPRVEPTVAAAASREAPFGRYRPVLAAIEAQPFSSPLLLRLQADLRGGGDAPRLASEEMLSLQKILGYAELRHNGLVHFFANTGLLWDVWCALALDRWRLRAGRRVRAWMQSLGQVEALASLATFADENPDYAFPAVEDGPPRYTARGLGHPLLPRDRRVTNDVQLGADGAPTAAPIALLVTGSNMSGKSTLLRAIGVNAVLALAGAPVCASSLAMTPVAVRTSMRISDSLEHGVSHFYAELLRLKGVVDSANRGERVLFLLDEILHGTNSRERVLGGQAVVKHLIAHGAIGAVSSHDLGLSPLEEETSGRVRNVHFEELVVEDKMSFDYRLKPGVVSSANALRLMRIAGIGVDLPDA